MSSEQTVTAFVQRARQPIGDFYVGTLTVRDILRITSFDFRRMEFTSGYIDFLGIQRRVDPSRSRKIAQYAQTQDACFPTSIVIALEEKCVEIVPSEVFGLDTIKIQPYIDDLDSALNIKLNEVGSIVDGQHRLSGLKEAEAFEVELPVTLFVGADPAIEASIFSIVNLAQTKVNKSLVYDLFALQRRRSPERTAHEVVVNLDRLKDSPFEGRIMRLGAATPGRQNETITQATIVKGVLPYITSDPLADRDIGSRFGFWEPPTGPEVRRRIFRKFFVADEDEKILGIMVNYFSAISKCWPESWNGNDEGDILRRTNGYLGFMRFLRPLYNELAEISEVPSQAQFLTILKNCSIPDRGFRIEVFPPGSSGAKRIYDRLVNDTGIMPT